MKRSARIALVFPLIPLAGCSDQPAFRTGGTDQPPLAEYRKATCDRPQDFSVPDCHKPHSGGSGGAGGHSVIWWHSYSGSTAYGPATPSAQAYAAGRANLTASRPSVALASAPVAGTMRGGFGMTAAVHAGGAT